MIIGQKLTIFNAKMCGITYVLTGKFNEDGYSTIEKWPAYNEQ